MTNDALQHMAAPRMLLAIVALLVLVALASVPTRLMGYKRRSKSKI